MNDNEILSNFVNSSVKLTAKEKRLFEYLYLEDGDPNIGATCRAIKTTARTLLCKTLPGLRIKLKGLMP